jgi:hypothetical protein
MGRGFGMIGAIAGVGNGLVANGNFLAEQEKADAEMGRRTKLEERLAALREQYAVQAETRAEEREIRKEGRTDERTETAKDKELERLQREAPVRRGVKIEDEKAGARAKSEVAAETADTDAGVKKKLTEAGQTESARKLQESQAGYYDANKEVIRQNADTKARDVDRKGGSTEELKAVSEQREALEKDIRKAKLAGTFDPKNPEHATMDTELRGLKLKERLLRSSGAPAAGGGAPAADPQGLRAKAQGTAAPAGGATGKPSTASMPGEDDRANIYRQEHREAQQRLSAAKTDEERARAQGDIAALQREAKAIGVSLDASSAGGGMIGAPKPAAGAAPAPLATAKAPPAARPTTDAMPASIASVAGTGAAPATPAAGGAANPQLVADLRAKATGGTATPATAATPAKPQGDPLLTALGAAGGGSADKIVAERAPAIRQAADQIKAAQQQVVQAANSQNPQAVQQATQQVQAAARQLDELLKGMMPAQAAAVKKALGV